MIIKMEVNQPLSAMPALTFPNTDMMLSDVTEGDIEERHLQIFGPLL